MGSNRCRDLNFTQLQTFQLVMEHGGYAAAARVAQISVPSVWQQIRGVEKAYGVRMFERAGRQIEPTPAAIELHEHVSAILAQMESTFDVLQESKSHTIRLVAGARMLMEDLVTPLSTFRRQHSNRLIIRHGNNRRAEELLLAEEVDLALALEPGVMQKSPLIHYEPAYTVDFLAVAQKKHPYVVSRTKSLRELSKHDLVVTATGTHGRDALDQAFHRENLVSKIVAETDNSAFTIACVSAGMGVGILAGRSSGELCRKLFTHSLSRQLGRRRIVVMWRKGRLLTQPLVDMVEAIQSIQA